MVDVMVPGVNRLLVLKENLRVQTVLFFVQPPSLLSRLGFLTSSHGYVVPTRIPYLAYFCPSSVPYFSCFGPLSLEKTSLDSTWQYVTCPPSPVRLSLFSPEPSRSMLGSAIHLETISQASSKSNSPSF